MKSIVMAACAAVLVALSGCGEKAQPTESVEALVANPERLRELRAQCKADHAQLGDAQCNAVAEATRRRFLQGAKASKTPAPVAPVPASAASGSGS